MTRLFNSARNGDAAPPVDTRYLKKPLSKSGEAVAEIRADVISYLNSLYESLAETLPDSKDETFDDIKPDDVSRQKLRDAYSIELNKRLESHHEPNVDVAGPFASVKPPKTRKQRTVMRGVKLNLDRVGGDELGNKEVRWLPPGSMSELWAEYKSQSALTKPAAFCTFWRVLGQVDF